MSTEYSPEVKARVMAALLAGQSAASIARETGIPKGTIAAWRSRHTDPMAREVAEIALAATVATQRDLREQIQNLILELLIAGLRSQINLADHAGDRGWLRAQDAQGVAMLQGVGNDKLFRLLQALDDRNDINATQD